MEDGVGGNDPVDQAGGDVEETQPDGAAPVLPVNWASQSTWACTVYAARSSGLSERPKPIRSGATARRPRSARRATTVR